MSSALERQLQEVAALAAIYGQDALHEVPQSWRLGIDALLTGAPADLEAWCLAHAGAGCRGALHVAGGAHISFDLPPAYPEAGHAARVHVGGQLSRSQADALTQQLQEQAEGAAAMGCECLHDLAQALEAALAATGHQDPQGPGAASSTGTPAGQPPAAGAGSPAPAPALQVALLRLDHMRDRAGYGRSIRGWCRELGLTGRLLLCGPAARPALILILVEGAGPDIAQYLLRQRTVAVDVDASGRKCRERLMDVLLQQPAQQRRFGDFREEALGGYADVAAVLGPVVGWGLQEVRAAAGHSVAAEG